MIAVVIPWYGEPIELLERSIDSALSVPKVASVVVVDDAHPAGPPPVTGPRVLVRSRSVNGGPAAATNYGIIDSMGWVHTWVARLDCGDTFDAEAKDLQIEATLEHQRPTFSWWRDETGDRVPPHDWHRVIYHDGTFALSTCVFSVAHWRAVGGFDESLRYADDWDFAMKIQHRIGWVEFAAVTTDARMLPGGHTDSARRDPRLGKLRTEEQREMLRRGRAITHPR